MAWMAKRLISTVIDRGCVVIPRMHDCKTSCVRAFQKPEHAWSRANRSSDRPVYYQGLGKIVDIFGNDTSQACDVEV